EEIDEDLISSHLYHNDGGGVRNTNGVGSERSEVKTSVDLIIRTGGEKRLSNFVPWQSLGNECAAYFCAPFWPCFRRIDLLRAIRTYQQREEERKMTEVGRILKVMRCFL
ncbi:MAG: undecaprenyl diphosphate synthase family protein, partial [Methanophagales archaeon]|nr:undecaprenyl diphosphate synthase family protein [Methanophagales archaeon]